MFSKLSQREKILVYTLLGLLAVFVLYKYVFLQEIAYYSDTKANYDILSAKIADYTMKANKLDDLKKEEEVLLAKVYQVTAPFNVDIMGGQQVSFIGQRLESAGLKIADATPVAPRVYDDFYVQDIDFNIQGTYGGLQQFFYDTENSPYAYKIVKFQILPQPIDGLDPSLVSINYNNLNSHLLISVVADKAAKVAKPVNETVKFDIFKPSDEEIAKLQNLKAQQDQKKNPEQAPTGDIVVVDNGDNSQYTPPAPTSDTQTQSGTKVTSNVQDIIKYSFDKK